MSLDFAAKFWARVEKSDGCWTWIGWVSPYGYGNFGSGKDGMPRMSHRISFVLTHGRALNVGEFVLHSCDNRRCVNPAHLRVGTLRDNYHDAKSRNRHSAGERHGLVKNRTLAARGEATNHTKITADQVREIRALAAAGVRRQKLAEDFNITRANVGFIVRRYTWAHVE